LPFEVKPLGVRGRIVRLGPLIDEIISKHDYPDNVSTVLAEAVALVAMLGNSLKFDGKLILQTRTDGPLSMLVVDYTSPGKMRGYAHFDPQAVGGIENASELIGKGHLALTIDQGDDMDNYQGIVALGSDTDDGSQVLANAAHHYFQQSEQIPTSLKLAAGYLTDGNGRNWRAGAIMVQHMPKSGPASPISFSSGDGPDGHEDEVVEDDNWTKARLLLETTESHELLDPMLEPQRLLFRLYHEDGVTVYPPVSLCHECTCSRQRVLDMLAGFSDNERADMVVDGMVEVVCQFCSNTYRIKPEEI
ncbi:MAG TPA: Hsp33 family molecular chaperone, partial [Rhizobiales bacterium]|nr:Hsp33 family molecular chaperone [Hyphomicrobiales bacterium]